MNWDELNSAWVRQQGRRLSDGEIHALTQALGDKSRRLARALFWRDIREIAAGALVVWVFGQTAYRRGPQGWPLWISTALVLIPTLYFISERLRTRRSRVGPGAPLLTKIDSELRELRHQYWLLMNVGIWYLGPIVLSWAIIMVYTGFHGLSGKLRAPASMIAYCGSALVFFGWVWWLNRSRARKSLEPKITELETIRNSLLTG